MRVKVFVTKEDIQKGRKKDSCLCPIALALKKIFKVNAVGIEVRDDTVYHYTDTNTFSAMLPAKATKFVHSFDNGKTVAPFSMILNFEK